MKVTRITIGVLAAVGCLLLPTTALLAASEETAPPVSPPERLLAAWQFDGPASSAPVLSGRFGPEPDAVIGAIAAADLDGNGTVETVVGLGDDQEPAVFIYDSSASQVASFAAYDPGMKHGLTLALGDLDGDGLAEIITGTGPGAAGHVRVLDPLGRPRLLPAGFFPFGRDQRAGVRLATGDLDGDGRDEIITASGPGERPQVAVWKIAAGADPELLADFAPFEGQRAPGISLAVADFDRDGLDEIATALAGPAEPTIRVFDVGPATEEVSTDADADTDATDETSNPSVGLATVLGEFPAIGNGFHGGLNLAAADLNHDDWPDILVAPTTGGGPRVFAYDRYGTPLADFFADQEDYRGGLLLASYQPPRPVGLAMAAYVDSTGAAEPADGDDSAAETEPAIRLAPTSDRPLILTAPADLLNSPNRPYLPQYIKISISEQRLYAYEYGQLARTFLVSTGTVLHPTPIGDFSVLAKPYEVDYVWSYGPNNPDNYDLGRVPYNLRFYPHIYIHYAPWHNNFGHRMSHGCVNVNRTNAEWIYNWAEVGTAVKVEP